MEVYNDGPKVFPESVCEGFFVKKHLQNYVSSTSSHLHLCTSTFSPISLLIFTSTFTSAHLHLGSSSHPHIYIHICTSHLGSSSHPHIYISAHLHLHTSTSLLIFTSAHLHLCSSSHPHIYISHLHLSLFLTFSLKAGGSAAGAPRNATLCGDRACRGREMQARVRFDPVAAQPGAEIVRVEGAKCRRECDLSRSGATLCGDRARRGREMQARVRFGPGPAQPSAEIVRVEGAKCRRECVLARSGATLSRARQIVRVEGAKCRRECDLVLSRRNPLRRAFECAKWIWRAQPSAEIVRVEGAKCRLECVLARSGVTLCGDHACRLCSATLVRGAICGAGS